MKVFFKKHKKVIIIIGIVLVVLIALMGIISLVAPDYRKSLYGDRLDDVKEHKIDSKKIDAIKKEVKALDYASDITYDLKGKIMNFVITVNKDTSLENAKKTGTTILNGLDKNEKDNYDIQVFLITSEDSDTYPVIGYKHKTRDEIAWTK
ncbi:MAG: hypothetical protein V8Q75_03965 [Bacilli bacterium]